MSYAIDYFVIVFTGHGYATEEGNTMLELSPGNDCMLNNITTWLARKHYLIILDSCRQVLQLNEGGQINDQRLFNGRVVETEYRHLCKELYNNALDAMPVETHAIAYAASLNQAANDTSLGGLYSHKLLSLTNEWIRHARENLQHNGELSQLLSFQNIHRQVTDIVRRQTNDRQIPQLTSNHEIPFAVVVNEQAGMPMPEQKDFSCLSF